MSLERIPPLSRFEESAERRALIERLREMAVGEVISYGEMSALVGSNIHEVWHFVSSARDALLKEGMAYDVVRTVGLKRLDDDGKVAASEGYLDKAKHSAKRSVRLLRAADFEALSPPAKTRFAVAEIRAGAVLQFSRPSAIKKITNAIQAGEQVKKLKSAVSGVFAQFGAK